MGRQEVLGGVRSHQEVSRGVRRCREESGVVRSCQKVSGVCKITCLYEESNIMVFVAKASLHSPYKEVSNFLFLLPGEFLQLSPLTNPFCALLYKFVYHLMTQTIIEL